MGWIACAALVAIVFVGLWRFARLPKSALEYVFAALLLGVAGYAWQGTPDLAGSPTPPPAATANPDSVFAQLRGSMTEKLGQDGRVLDTADAFHRNGLDAYSVGIIKGALEKRPRSADLWVGLGNALVLHNQGVMSPAAQLAFQKAADIDPAHPGPPFFMGLALAQAGQTGQAAEIWRGLLARAPTNAPWRGDVEQRLAQIGG